MQCGAPRWGRLVAELQRSQSFEWCVVAPRTGQLQGFDVGDLTQVVAQAGLVLGIHGHEALEQLIDASRTLRAGQRRSWGAGSSRPTASEPTGQLEVGDGWNLHRWGRLRSRGQELVDVVVAGRRADRWPAAARRSRAPRRWQREAGNLTEERSRRSRAGDARAGQWARCRPLRPRRERPLRRHCPTIRELTAHTRGLPSEPGESARRRRTIHRNQRGLQLTHERGHVSFGGERSHRRKGGRRAARRLQQTLQHAAKRAFHFDRFWHAPAHRLTCTAPPSTSNQHRFPSTRAGASAN